MLIHMLATVHGRQARDKVGIDQSCAQQDHPSASFSVYSQPTSKSQSEVSV